jgi:DNA polymerase-3 subunit beta
MQLTIPKNTLAKLISRATSATSPKSSMPILASVLLTAEANGKVTVVGTDLTVSVTTDAVCEVKTPGSCALTARAFNDIVKALPTGDVKIEVKDSRLEIKAGKSRFKLPVGYADDFPAIPVGTGKEQALSLTSRDLAGALKRGGYAQSNDETRAHLFGAKIEFSKSRLTVVSTDGHRVATASVDASSDTAWGDDFIARPATVVISRVAEEFSEAAVEITKLTSGFTRFAWPGVVLTCKRGDDQFPPYRKVIPANNVHHVDCNRQMLVDALKRCGLVIDDKAGGMVRLDLSDGALLVTGESGSKGAATEQVEVTYVGKGLAIGINGAYLAEALSAVTDDDVRLELGTADSPVVVRGAVSDDVLSATMPMRLDAGGKP